MLKLAEFSAPELANALPAVAALFILLGALALVLQVWLQCRKLFGKTPPMHEQIAKLRDEIMHAAASHQAEDDRELTRLEGKIDNVDRDVRQLRQDINTNGELRKNFMLGEIDKHCRRLDEKIERVSETQTAQLIAALKGKHD